MESFVASQIIKINKVEYNGDFFKTKYALCIILVLICSLKLFFKIE